MVKVRLHQRLFAVRTLVLRQQVAICGLRHTTGLADVAIEQNENPTVHFAVLIIVAMQQLVVFAMIVTLIGRGVMGIWADRLGHWAIARL